MASKKFIQKVIDHPDKAAALALSTYAAGVSTANLASNRKRQKESKEYQDKQLEAMGKLTNSLNKVDGSLKKLPTEETKTKKGFKFFQKNHSHTADLAMKGAVVGATLAGGTIPLLPEKIGQTPVTEQRTNQKGEKYTATLGYKDNPDSKIPAKFREKYNGSEAIVRNALIEVSGIVLGAALGGLAGLVMDASDAINKKTTVNNRLLKNVIENLKKSGYQVNKDYILDPAKADFLKSKVCLVISRHSDTLKLLINTATDSKLKSVTNQITKNLPGMSTVNEKAGNRFNEINITTMTSNNGDAIWVSSVAERFIKAGFPVYIVEVG